MAPKPRQLKAQIPYKIGRQMEPSHGGSKESSALECATSFSSFSGGNDDAIAYKFDNADDGHELFSRLESLDSSSFVRPRFSAKQDRWYHVVGSSGMGDSFISWCKKNYDNFWKLSKDNKGNYDIISLSDDAKKLFGNMAQGLKVYHDGNTGHGNLMDGFMVTPEAEIKWFNEHFESKDGFETIMLNDLESFRVLVQKAMDIVEQQLLEVDNISINADQHPAVIAFKELYGDLHKFSGSSERIKEFEFYVRNNPLFMNTKESYMFMQKFVDMSQFDSKTFERRVRLEDPDTDIKGWGTSVTNPTLTKVFQAKASQYQDPHGATIFVRNAFVHAKDNDKTMDNGVITNLIVEDMPFLLPKWWLAMIRCLGLNHSSFKSLSRTNLDLIGFLKKPPSCMD